MSIPFELRLLGRLELHRGGEPVTELQARKTLALLSYLATSSRAYTRPALAGLLWGGMPESKARGNLSKALSTLRRIVGNHLTITRQEVAFKPGSGFWLDAAEFEAGASSDSIEELQEAIQLYEGDFLDDFYVRNAPEFEDWALGQKAHLRELALRVLQTLAAHFSEQGEAGQAQAIEYSARLLRLEPWREEAHRQMMLLLANSGQRGAALAQYQTCRQLLAEELGVEPAAETTTLFEEIQAGRHGPVGKDDQGHSPRSIRHNLTPHPTPFVGRQSELDQLLSYLHNPDVRLITITGPGGIGKTRLAIAAAQRIVADSQDHAAFSNGVFFASLAPLSEAEHIAQAIADVFDVRLESSDTAGQLLRLLGGKRLLLIVDNFEHLLEGAAQLSEILKVAPESKIIVTSRERLQLLEEQIFPIEGLDYPSTVTLKDLASYPAMELFAQTARRVQPGFSPEERELAMMATICKRLEGMPLAIEMAAAWSDTIPLADIVAELQVNLDLLETQMRNVPPRHRSMRAIFDASWDRLREQERKVMGYLCPFRGGFTRHAAQAVAGATLPILSRLGNKSLIQPRIAEQRYQVHELLRQFTTEKMTVSGAIELARDAHSEYYLNYVFQRQEDMSGRDQKEALKAVSAEFENVRVAWLWAARRKNFESIARAMDALFLIYCSHTRRWFDGSKLWQSAVGLLAPKPHEEPHPVYFRLVARHPAPRADEVPLLEDALKFARQQGDTQEVAQCQCMLGWANAMTGELQTGISLLEEGTRLFRQRHDKSMLAEWLRPFGIAYQRNGQGKEALKAFHEGLALHREMNDLASIGNTLHELVWLLRQEGRFHEADVSIQELVGIYRELEVIHGITVSQFGAAGASFLKGDFDEAESWVRQAQSLVTEASYYGGEFELGLLANLQGRHEQAWQLLETYQKFSKVARKEFYAEWGLSLTACCLERYEVARQQLLTTLTLATTTRGQGLVALTLPVAALMLANLGQTERAAELLALGRLHLPGATGWLDNWSLFANLPAATEGELGSDPFTAAWERGESLDLWKTAEELLKELADL